MSASDWTSRSTAKRLTRQSINPPSPEAMAGYPPKPWQRPDKGDTMKYIVAIIQPDRVDEVLQLLEQKEIHLVTVSNVMGRGRQKGVAEVYRSHKEAGSLLRKVKLEIAVNDEYVKSTIEAITGGAKTGNIGDGKIFVLDLKEVIRIRTGETGGVAVG
jgi:nitrogen regulatory protein P-II 2